MENILVVDDDELVRSALCEMIKNLGYQVNVSTDGPQAIDEATHGYSLIFMDIGLPSMNGIEVSSAIRRNELSGQHTPIIVLTSHQRTDIEAQCFAAGVNEVLAKPLALPKLVKIFESYLQKVTT